MQIEFSLFIHKFMNNYIFMKILKNIATVIAAVLESMIIWWNESEAVSELLKLLCLCDYHSQLLKFLHFQCQLKLYIKIYLSNYFFEINTITHYSRTSEVCITICKSIKQDIIKYLCKILIFLTEEKKQRLVATSCDFIIITFSCRKSISLFLDFRCFVNHDCEANAKLSVTKNDIQIVIIWYINIDEKITVIYESDYFDQNNCECFYVTCAFLQWNRWTIDNKKTEISAFLNTENNENYLMLRMTTIKKRNRRFKIHACDMQMLHYTIYWLKNQICL